ncbi:hypothetical protein D3C75_869380 [compost metagenome]
MSKQFHLLPELVRYDRRVVAFHEDWIGAFPSTSLLRPVLVAVVADFPDKHRIVEKIADGTNGKRLACSGFVPPIVQVVSDSLEPVPRCVHLEDQANQRCLFLHDDNL